MKSWFANHTPSPTLRVIFRGRTAVHYLPQRLQDPGLFSERVNDVDGKRYAMVRAARVTC